ncbi:hypothetical protein K469DRAFT_729738 [Zopfia rhizophila CBS 207.26]|uniref:GroES-like protein n=1 Tax=Zopfia rhizophila CBS 207.26 TaxID=1314779 RepID=A0A6A6DMS3_9PEZI|nr:hypothetical protein K469DRAFT_729738 [Zopfia rhizophila CBS 207.26]
MTLVNRITVAVAINPTDYKMLQNFPCPGTIIGCDFAGSFVRIGDDAQGALAEYVRTSTDLVFRVQDHMSWENVAATGGIGHGSLCLALWGALGLSGRPEKSENPEYALVYVMRTFKMATNRITCKRWCGLIPIAICSPHYFSLAKSYSAAAVFDYASTTVAEDVRAYIKGTLFYASDYITDEHSVSMCYAAICRSGKRYVSLEYCPPHLRTRRAVHASLTLEYEISTHPVIVVRGGWSGILNSIETLCKGDVSGQELVARLTDY